MGMNALALGLLLCGLMLVVAPVDPTILPKGRESYKDRGVIKKEQMRAILLNMLDCNSNHKSKVTSVVGRY